MKQSIKEKLSLILTLEFWLLGIPFIFSNLVFSVFVSGYAAKYFIETRHSFIAGFGFFILSFLAIFYLIVRICKNKKSSQEKSLTNFFKTRSKKLIFLALFAIWQFFNFTGFCYSEMRYLKDKELVDRVVGQEFVMEDREQREEALNRKCSISEAHLTESELNKKFATRKCVDISYSSWGEFFKKRLDRQCSEDLDKYDCGTFYYSSLEEFYKENPNCCEVNNLPVYDVPYSASKLDIVINKLFSNGEFSVEMSILKIDKLNELLNRLNRAGWTENNPEFPYLHVYFGVNYCGKLGDNWGEGETNEDHKNYLKRKLLNNKI